MLRNPSFQAGKSSSRPLYGVGVRKPFRSRSLQSISTPVPDVDVKAAAGVVETRGEAAAEAAGGTTAGPVNAGAAGTRVQEPSDDARLLILGLSVSKSESMSMVPCSCRLCCYRCCVVVVDIGLGRERCGIATLAARTSPARGTAFR